MGSSSSKNQSSSSDAVSVMRDSREGVSEEKSDILRDKEPTIRADCSGKVEQQLPSTPMSSSENSAYRGGKYSLKRPIQSFTGDIISPTALYLDKSILNTPPTLMNRNSSSGSGGGQKSSGRYKIGKQVESLKETDPVFSPSTELPSSQNGQDPPCEEFNLDPIRVFLEILNKRKSVEAPDAQQEEWLALMKLDQTRFEEIERCSKRRSQVLQASGIDKDKLLKQYEEEDNRAESEKRTKIEMVKAVVLKGSTVRLSLQVLDDLMSWMARYETEIENYNELKLLLDDCNDLINESAKLKESFENKAIDTNTLNNSLTTLFTEEKKQLADRMRNSDDSTMESRMMSWVLNKLGSVKATYLESTVLQISALRRKMDSPETTNAVSAEDIARIRTHLVEIGATDSVSSTLKCGQSLASIIGNSPQRSVDVFLRSLCVILDHVETIPSNRPVAISTFATMLFSLFRFMSQLPSATQDQICYIFIQTLQSRCELCIPSVQGGQPLNMQIMTFFAIMVAFAGYIVPSSISSSGTAGSLWKVEMRGKVSRLPVSVITGFKWLERAHRLLSDRLRVIACADDTQAAAIADAEKVCGALRIFLDCAGHSLLCCLSRDSDMKKVIDALINCAEKASPNVKAAEGLLRAARSLSRGVFTDSLRIMNQEPRTILNILELSYFYEECDVEIVTFIKERRKVLSKSSNAVDQECSVVIADINTINLNSDIDKEGIWIRSFLQKYQRSFENDGWRTHTMGKPLYSYCLNHLCNQFTDKFRQDTFDIKKSLTYILGIIELCKNPDLQKRMFPYYLKMYFYQRCPLLVPVLDSGATQLSNSEKRGAMNMLGVFALLIMAQNASPSVKCPFQNQEGWSWYANIVNLWHRYENKNNLQVEQLLAKLIREFIRPGGDVDGIDPSQWYQMFKSPKYVPITTKLRDINARKVQSLGNNTVDADQFQALASILSEKIGLR